MLLYQPRRRVQVGSGEDPVREYMPNRVEWYAGSVVQGFMEVIERKDQRP
jgi:hypothetical protein